jgi:hypothetical protein
MFESYKAGTPECWEAGKLEGYKARMLGSREVSFFQLASFQASELARIGFCNVDLVFMTENDIVLQYEAVRQNIVVYQASGFDRGATYSRIVRQYLDFYPYLTVVRAEIDIDRKIVYDVLQNNIRDLEDLKRAFAQFL